MENLLIKKKYSQKLQKKKKKKKKTSSFPFLASLSTPSKLSKEKNFLYGFSLVLNKRRLHTEFKVIGNRPNPKQKKIKKAKNSTSR
jgi:hypothetical protein